MASELKNLSSYSSQNLIDIQQKNFAVIVAEWNDQVTSRLLEGALSELKKLGAQNILVQTVPGSYELPLAAQWIAKQSHIDAVICLGCIIQGETRHFDFIAQAVAQGLIEVSLRWDKPVVFGVLTTEDLNQALERAGGKHGNKGVEAAATAVKMLGLAHNLSA